MRKPLLSRHFRFIVAALFALLCGISGASAADRPEYLASFDPAKGFKPAQRDLTEIFLQLAGSLEAHGNPEPYLRHVASEHKRIENLYRQKFGRDPKSYRPAHLTDANIDKLAANWKLLSPKLGLDTYAKGFGHFMRDAIKGTRGNGTMVVNIFNQHQTRVFDSMSGKAMDSADFESLRAELVRRLELDKKVVDENRYEIPKRDAISYAIILHGTTMKLFKRIDAGLKPEAAAAVKSVLTGIIMDTGAMAHSELQAGMSEWGFEKLSARK